MPRLDPAATRRSATVGEAAEGARAGKSAAAAGGGDASAPAIELRDVRKLFHQRQQPASFREVLRPPFKEVAALGGVSFVVAPGEFVAYAGPNGAGKSTTIKLLGGMLAPDAGSVRALGMDPMHRRIPLMRRVGVLFGNRTELWWDHPVSLSYRWKKAVWDIPEGVFHEMEALVLDLLDIRPFYGTLARELSLGQRMRADLGMMLLHRPELILLDEPTLGLDVLAKRRMIEFLKQLNEREGTTVLVTSHDMDDLEEMARRILLLSEGRLAFDGDFAALRERLRIERRAVVTFENGEERTYPYTDTRALLAELAALPGVADVRFTQTSLEEGVANLYQSWQPK